MSAELTRANGNTARPEFRRVLLSCTNGSWPGCGQLPAPPILCEPWELGGNSRDKKGQNVGAELWIDKETVRSATGWSDRTIRWKVQLGTLRLRKTSNGQKRGFGQREYALSSLPVEAQIKFLKQPLLSGPDCTALALRSDLNQSNLFASLPEVPEPERHNFSAEQNAQALKRLEAIAPLVEFSSRSRRSRPTFRTIGGVAVRSMSSLAGYLADQHHVSTRTLWNWYGQYRKLGYAGLVDRVRSDKGKSRFLQAHPAVRAYIENKYLGERLSIR